MSREPQVRQHNLGFYEASSARNMVMKQQQQTMTIADKEDRAGAGAGDCKYKGVRKRKWGKYVSEIRLPNSRERIWLGSYDTAEKAARAFDAAVFCLRGRSGKFNFPDSPPEIPGGRSLTRPEIQEAAARFAESAPTQLKSDPNRETGSHCSLSETVTTGSFSDGTVQFELDLQNEFLSDGGSFLDGLTTMGSGNYATDYGFFPAYDEYYSPELPYPGVENFDGAPNQESIFLWNF